MGCVLHDLAGVRQNQLKSSPSVPAVADGWHWASITAPAAATISVHISLKLSETRMSIPIPSCRLLVGRDAEVGEAAAALVASSHSRVLLHGLPGVGKDATAAAVVRSQAVALAGLRLQAWLQGSTADGLQRQLVDVFTTHRREVVAECEQDQAKALDAIKAWLGEHAHTWLFVVEDVSGDCQAVWDCFPEGKGRLLITSQEPCTAVETTYSIKLQPFSTEDSKELWRGMKVLSRKSQGSCDEASLEAQCNATCGAVQYIGPGAEEKGKALKERHKEIQAALFAHEQLSLPETECFLENELGNLPLSVSLCGHLLREEGTVQGLAALFAKVSLSDVDRRGRNPQTDAHYLGLQRSVMIAIHRIQESITMDEETRHAVVPLLVALALLPRANTPHRLLHGSRFAAGPEGGGGCLAVFEDGQLLARALAVLRQYGLLQDGIPDMIGTMHQLVQRAVLERWLPEGGAAAEGIGELVIPAVRRTLQEGFQSETGLNMGLRPASEWPRFRELVPCVQRWRQLLSRGCIQETEADGHLISELAGLLMTLGEHHEALALSLIHI
eukprot:TRINITY_DN8196_c0_g2_i4.p1 TRINITY_DN8196_c0_g2~~TRINITY_DN8196_c0_g2_i4.p1  ORF type:complete len:557 (-),score=103.46 TRINITY_DN8196_c0_g2_i4:156-1826(-)